MCLLACPPPRISDLSGKQVSGTWRPARARGEAKEVGGSNVSTGPPPRRTACRKSGEWRVGNCSNQKLSEGCLRTANNENNSFSFVFGCWKSPSLVIPDGTVFGWTCQEDEGATSRSCSLNPIGGVCMKEDRRVV